jgi:hypothetical protein
MEESLPMGSPQSSQGLGPTAIEEIICSRAFLADPSWSNRGWFEARLWRWLDHRERALVEFAFPDGISIAASWYKVFIAFAIIAVAVTLAKIVFPALFLWLALGGLALSLISALAQVLSSGTAFQSISFSGVTIPLYAAIGIGLRELTRVLLKLSFIQIPFLICYTLAGSLFGCLLLGYPCLSGAIFAVKLAGLVLASRFIFLTFSFSSGTNDSSKFRLRTIGLFSVIIGFPVLFLVLGGASLFFPNQLLASGLFCLACLDAYVFFCVYGWFYHANRFDLMNQPQPAF